MHRIVPTSLCVRGDKTLAMLSTLSVFEPGSKTELPLNTDTRTSFPALTKAPTSTSLDTGCPSRTAELEDFGMKRTRPDGYHYVRYSNIVISEGQATHGRMKKPFLEIVK